jgi:GH24 family phage-related lysozyme (muramidase)
MASAPIQLKKLPTVSLHISQAGLGFIYRHEAQRGVSNHLYWPGGASGVTLGAGYDMKERTKNQVSADMVRICVPKAIADKIANGAGLSGSKAEDFADDNHDLVTLTNAQETALLAFIIPHYEAIVRRNVHVPLTQYEFDALVSFVFNPGASFLPVASDINQGKISAAMSIIKSRTLTGGARSQGLLQRRIDEIQLFLHGAYHSHQHKH